MPQDAKAVANYFLGLSRRDNEPLTPMKLQKLVYFAHGWYLAVHNEPLIYDRVEAWPYGPVIPSLYREFKDFGSGAITRKAQEWDYEDGTYQPQLTNTVDEDLLQTVWNSYRDLTAIQLSNATHEPGSPWDQARLSAPYQKTVDIDNKLIRDYFLNQMNVAA